MKIYKLSILLTTLLSLFLFSCHNDVEEENIIETRVPSPNITTLYKGNLTVYVTDLLGNPVEGALVFVYDEQTATNTWGLAEFSDIPMDANGTYVRALKDNHFFGSDKFFPTSIDNFTSIRLFPIENGKTFDPSTNVTIEVEGGGHIDFTANTVVDDQNNIVQDEVIVYSYRLSTDMPALSALMPGALLGIDKENSTRVLGTYGMVAVELRDNNGNELNIKDGSFATITFPIEEKLLGDAPTIIPLWYFDELNGNWIEEGNAALENGSYVGEVGHFSFWNCDVPFPLVNFSGTILTESGVPAATSLIRITAGPMVASGYTNVDGHFSGKFPKDENLEIEVIPSGCTESVYESEIGPFLNDVILDDIVIANNVTITGSVICSGTPSESAKVILKFPNMTYQTNTNISGEFSFVVSEFLCDESSIGEIFAQEPSTNIISVVKTVDIDNLSGFIFDVCSDCDFTYTIKQNVPDLCVAAMNLELTVENGSGDYSYLWDSGETSSTVTLTESQSKCVTITDNIAECDYSICEEFDLLELMSATSSFEDKTCYNNGSWDMNVTGGTMPYVFNVSGPNSYFSNSSSLFDLEPGLYTANITDDNNCQLVLEQEIKDFASDIELEILTSSGTNEFCIGNTIGLTVECVQCSLDLNNALWTFPDGTSANGQTIEASIEGLYSVQINDMNCEGLTEIALSMEQAPAVDTEMNCFNNGYVLSIPNIPSGYTFQSINIDYETSIIGYNTLMNGDVQVYSSTGCVFEYDYNLPNLQSGIEVESFNQTSCDTCDDGFIAVNESNITCVSCNYDTFYIYKEGDYTNDLKSGNMASDLSTGVYYLVGKSTDGCIIYSASITL